jgi:hypothetical protein
VFLGIFSLSRKAPGQPGVETPPKVVVIPPEVVCHLGVTVPGSESAIAAIESPGSTKPVADTIFISPISSGIQTAVVFPLLPEEGYTIGGLIVDAVGGKGYDTIYDIDLYARMIGEGIDINSACIIYPKIEGYIENGTVIMPDNGYSIRIVLIVFGIVRIFRTAGEGPGDNIYHQEKHRRNKMPATG